MIFLVTYFLLLMLNLKSCFKGMPFLCQVTVGLGIPESLHFNLTLLPSATVKEGRRSDTFGGIAVKKTSFNE
jgi:hypothetical protein